MLLQPHPSREHASTRPGSHIIRGRRIREEGQVHKDEVYASRPELMLWPAANTMQAFASRIHHRMDVVHGQQYSGSSDFDMFQPGIVELARENRTFVMRSLDRSVFLYPSDFLPEAEESLHLPLFQPQPSASPDSFSHVAGQGVLENCIHSSPALTLPGKDVCSNCFEASGATCFTTLGPRASASTSLSCY
jgi:hypothetical protein